MSYLTATLPGLCLALCLVLYLIQLYGQVHLEETRPSEGQKAAYVISRLVALVSRAYGGVDKEDEEDEEVRVVLISLGNCTVYRKLQFWKS